MRQFWQTRGRKDKLTSPAGFFGYGLISLGYTLVRAALPRLYLGWLESVVWFQAPGPGFVCKHANDAGFCVVPFRTYLLLFFFAWPTVIGPLAAKRPTIPPTRLIHGVGKKMKRQKGQEKTVRSVPPPII
jgi:hypothetical protein